MEVGYWPLEGLKERQVISAMLLNAWRGKNGWLVLFLGAGLPAVVLLLLILYFFQGMADFSVRLAGDYELWRLSGGAFAIFESQQEVVPAGVEEFAAPAPYVVGRSSSVSGVSGSEEGYFLINTQTHEVRKGLSEAQWQEELRSAGVRAPVELRPPPPTWLHARLGGYRPH